MLTFGNGISISIKNFKEFYLWELKAVVLENTAHVFAKVLLSMNWQFQWSADWKTGCGKEASLSLWRVKLGVQVNGQAFFLKRMTVFVDNPQIRFKTRFTNAAKDHHIRLLFKIRRTSESSWRKHLWGGDKTKWTSCFLEQHQQAFVSRWWWKGWRCNKKLHSMKSRWNDTIAVTILRASGELGDTGVADQRLSAFAWVWSRVFAIECKHKSSFSAFRRAKSLQTPFTESSGCFKQKKWLRLVASWVAGTQHLGLRPALKVAEWRKRMKRRTKTIKTRCA